MRKESCGNRLSDVKVDYIKKNLIGSDILDVGAGYCYYSEWIAKNYPTLNVSSIDQLDLASVNGVNFICSDLEKPIPLPDNSFSTILSFDIIEHIHNETLIIDELYRLCKPGGILIGSVPHDDDKFLPAYNLTFYHRSDLTHKRYYTPSTLKEALNKSHFDVITIDLKGGVSPHIFAEFFPSKLRSLVKKVIGFMRRARIINTSSLASDLFFIATKKIEV